jgi:hypothetical protein
MSLIFHILYKILYKIVYIVLLMFFLVTAPITLPLVIMLSITHSGGDFNEFKTDMEDLFNESKSAIAKVFD